MSSEHHDEAVDEPRHLLRPFVQGPGGKIFLIWLVMTAIGVLAGFYVPHHILPHMLSNDGHTAWLTIVLFTVLAAPVAGLVYAIGAYSLLAWRHKGPSDEPPPDGPPLRGNSTATLVWLTVSTMLTVTLLVWGLAEFTVEQQSHPDTLQIDVVAQQWLWTFKYPGTGVETHTLELPVNRPVQFNVTSVDVTHGFWLAALGVQVDANPFVTTVIHTTPDHLGTFTVRCSQLCGLFHSFMYAPGQVVSARAFSSFLQANGSSATVANTVAQVSAT